MEFCRVIESKMTSAGQRAVPGRRSASVCKHGRAPDKFGFKFKSYDIKVQSHYSV